MWTDAASQLVRRADAAVAGDGPDPGAVLAELDALGADALIRFDERARSPRWAAEPLTRRWIARLRGRGAPADPQQVALAGLLALCDGDGHRREAAAGTVEAGPAGLRLLVLRAADWVPEVRRAALARLADEPAAALAGVLGFADRTARTRVRGEELGALLDRRLTVAHLAAGTRSGSATTRRAAWRRLADRDAIEADGTAGGGPHQTDPSPLDGGQHDTDPSPLDGGQHDTDPSPLDGRPHQTNPAPLDGGQHDTEPSPLDGGPHETDPAPLDGGPHDTDPAPLDGGPHETPPARLLDAADDRDPGVRAVAARCLTDGRPLRADVRRAIAERLREDPLGWVAAAALSALVELDGAPAVREGLVASRATVRRRAREWAHRYDIDVRAFALDRLGADPGDRTARLTLLEVAAPADRDRVLAMLQDRRAPVRAAALRTLAGLDGDAARAAALDGLTDAGRVARAAADVLRRLGPQPAELDALEARARDTRLDARRRLRALTLLRGDRWRHLDTVLALRDLDDDAIVHAELTWWLARHRTVAGGPAATRRAAIERHLRDAHPSVRRAVEFILRTA